MSVCERRSSHSRRIAAILGRSSGASAKSLLLRLRRERHQAPTPRRAAVTIAPASQSAASANRIVEKGLEQRIERAAAHLLAGDAGRVDIACAVAVVAHMAFLLENRKQRANRGSARRIGRLFADFRGRSFAETIERVHDLALAAAEPAALAFALVSRSATLRHAKNLALKPSCCQRNLA